MREILFRGRTTAGKEWVSGFYAVFSETPFIGAPNPQGTMLWFEVDPTTVGQYTGLTDKNGKRIFEGDVVVSTYARRLSNMPVVVEHCPINGYWMCQSKREPKVIGNIHDNPELLKEEQ